METKTVLDTDMVILLENQKVIVGILTDRVHGVRLIDSASVVPARGAIPKVMAEYVSGMISDKSAEV